MQGGGDHHSCAGIDNPLPVMSRTEWPVRLQLPLARQQRLLHALLEALLRGVTLAVALPAMQQPVEAAESQLASQNSRPFSL